MKLLTTFTFIFTLASSFLQAQTELDSTGLLGDNFSLEGALDLFKDAESLEAFELALNDSKNSANNLDLNQDGNVDYVRVQSYQDDDVHAIVLQSIIGDLDYQDVAVIEIEKTGKESASLQIIGDEHLYGDSLFVEPFEEIASSGGKGGPNAEYRLSRVVVNVWLWPSVRYIYRPSYRPYVSPYRWNAYPRVYKPWRPIKWRVFHVNTHHHRNIYRPVHTHRVIKARKLYIPKKRSSVKVVSRSKTVTRVNRNTNGRVVTRKNTTNTVVKRNGSKTVKSKSKVTKTKTKNGQKVQKKKVKKVKKKRGG